jgi:hypothetical protein
MNPFAVVLVTLLAATATADDAINCTGVWSPTTTEAALVRQYGRANVVRGMVYIAEGNETRGTIVFPNDEAKRVEIVWRDTRQRQRPEWIRVPAGSRWATIAGIRNGTSLVDVEKLNGKPFQLSGFDWDFGGLVTDWRKGALAKLSVPCQLQLRFDRTIPDRATAAQRRAADATSGDRDLLSSSPDLRRFPVQVNEIVLQYR